MLHVVLAAAWRRSHVPKAGAAEAADVRQARGQSPDSPLSLTLHCHPSNLRPICFHNSQIRLHLATRYLLQRDAWGIPGWMEGGKEGKKRMHGWADGLADGQTKGKELIFHQAICPRLLVLKSTDSGVRLPNLKLTATSQLHPREALVLGSGKSDYLDLLGQLGGLCEKYQPWCLGHAGSPSC